ncbi:aldehyde dehydrogenase family protein [Catellatospora coxensis]
MTGFSPNVIGDRIADGTSGERFTVVDPADGSTVAEYGLAGQEDVNAAVAAARAAFPGWSGATPGERSGALHRLAGLLSERAADFVAAEVAQTGKPVRLATEFDVPGTIDNTAFFAGAARDLQGKAAGSTPPTTPATCAARRSGWSARSRRGTTRCRWRPGRSCPPSRRATPSCSSPPS